VIRRGGGDVLEDGPALGEQGEPAFSLGAEVAQEAVAGAGVDVEFLVSGRLLSGAACVARTSTASMTYG